MRDLLALACEPLVAHARTGLSLAELSGCSRGYFVAGSGPTKSAAATADLEPTVGLGSLSPATAGCSGLSTKRRELWPFDRSAPNIALTPTPALRFLQDRIRAISQDQVKDHSC
ncbi:hypothetical protein R6Z07F_007665 [Ovis aries]